MHFCWFSNERRHQLKCNVETWLLSVAQQKCFIVCFKPDSTSIKCWHVWHKEEAHLLYTHFTDENALHQFPQCLLSTLQRLVSSEALFTIAGVRIRQLCGDKLGGRKSSFWDCSYHILSSICPFIFTPLSASSHHILPSAFTGLL